MGYLSDIKAKFESLATQVEAIKHFIFDDLSAVNADSQAQYQLLLLKPPVSESNDEDRTLEYSFCDMDVYVFQEHLSDNQDEWTVGYDDCHESMVKLLRLLFEDHPNYVLVGKVKITPGHMQHNANLIGARAQFKMRKHNGC